MKQKDTVEVQLYSQVYILQDKNLKISPGLLQFYVSKSPH